MPDLRANVTYGFDNLDERSRQMADDFSSPSDEKKAKKEEEIQKTTASVLSQFADQLNDTSLASKAKEHKMHFLQKDQLKDELHHFHDLLVKLKESDESFNPEFVLQIAIVWNHIIDNANFVKIVDIHKSINSELLHKLIASLELYPPHVDFSLSYYMMHFPGEQWYPFPLMEIFRHLHQEAHSDYYSSKLHEWISLLDAIIPSA